MRCAPTDNAIRININLTPEQLRMLNGRVPELRFDVKIGPVTVNPQPVVYEPPVYQPPVHQPRRVQDFGPRRSSGTIQDHFFALIRRGALLQQSDYRLGGRGLLVPDGGLCATTSAVNVLHAAFSHLGRDTSRFASADDLVHRLVAEAWNRLGRDARMGLDFDSLNTVINEVANRLDPGVGVHAEKSYTWRYRSGEDLKDIGGDEDTLALLAVTTSDTKSHAIAVIGLDTGRRTITYSDPNYPHQAIERRYFLNNGELQIDGFNGYGVLRDVLKIRTRAFDSSKSIRWQDYAGKRVWITGADGRRSLTTIDKIDLPSPEYPSGRAVQYSYYFGSGGGGTWPLDDIRRIEEVEAPSAEQIKSFEKYVGEKVRIRFVEEYPQKQYGGETYLVEGLSREKKPSHHPFGGLQVKSAKNEYGRSGVVPFEAIDSVELVDAKLESRKATPAEAQPAKKKRRIV